MRTGGCKSFSRRLLARATASSSPLWAGSNRANSSPAETGDGDAVCDSAAKPGRDLLEKEVAGGVAERVVDLLEPVEVDQHDGELRIGGTPAGEQVGEALLKEHAIRKTGEVVVQGPRGEGGSTNRAFCRVTLGVSGDRLEQPSVLLVERAHVPERLATVRTPINLIVGDQRRDNASLGALAGRGEPGFEWFAHRLRADHRAARSPRARRATGAATARATGPGLRVTVEHQPVDAMVVAGRQNGELRDVRPAPSSASGRGRR